MQQVDEQTLQLLAKMANIKNQLLRLSQESFQPKSSDIRLLEHDMNDFVSFLKKQIPDAGKRLEKTWQETDREKIKETLENAKEEKVDLSIYLNPLSFEIDAIKNQYTR